ncbi:MAG: PilZ domain-containing protein [Acidobacteria bacterium]|nr:PilZ domain-containing protein [Acidobacteriota bacterium]
MDSNISRERRRYRRYIVQGRVKFRIGSAETLGDVVNFGQGGMLIRSGVVLPEGSETTIQVKASCYPDAFEVSGQVVGVKNGRMAIKFLKKPKAVEELLLCLAQENYPWTDASAFLETAKSWGAIPTDLPGRMSKAEWEPSLEYLYMQD